MTFLSVYATGWWTCEYEFVSVRKGAVPVSGEKNTEVIVHLFAFERLCFRVEVAGDFEIITIFENVRAQWPVSHISVEELNVWSHRKSD